jgi:inner membrane protein YidH
MADDRSRDTNPPRGGRFDADGDATRRTHLANERTYLAWWRTGLACMAASVGVGRLLPDVTDGHTGLSIAAGIVFALLGIVFFGYGFDRYRKVDAAVRAGEYLRPDDRFVAGLAAIGVILALTTLAIVVI